MDAQRRIKELMEERKWTDYRLAKESNLSHSTVTNMFNRNNAPTLPTLEAVCRAFGITLAQLSTADRGPADTLLKMEYSDRPPKTDPPRSDRCHLKHIDPITGKDVLFFCLYPCCQLHIPFIQLVNSTSPISKSTTQLSTFFTVDQFPLTRKMKKSGNRNLSSDKPRLPEIPCFLHFFSILFFNF